MTLTVARCVEHIRHSLGGDSDLKLDPKWLINQAGEQLVAAHRWKWLERRPAHIATRARQSVTDWTWTDATLTLNNAATPSAQDLDADYTHLVGDRCVILDGTGATVGEYITQTNPTVDVITLNKSIGSAADASADIDFRIETDTCELPSDFKELVAINATESLVNSINMTSFDQLLWLRTNQVQITNFNFYGAISHASAVGGRGPQTPRLELWPTPITADPSAFTLIYRAGWNEISQDEQEISIPGWIETLYVQYLRAFARGFEEDEAGERGLHGYLAEVETSRYFDAMVSRDGMVQDTYGPLRGGAVESGVTWFDWGLHNTVSGPS